MTIGPMSADVASLAGAERVVDPSAHGRLDRQGGDVTDGEPSGLAGLDLIPLGTLHPRTRAGPARHELTVFRIAVKYSSRAMSGAGVRRSHHPRPQRDELPGRAGPRLTIRGMSALRLRANVSHVRGLSARDTC